MKKINVAKLIELRENENTALHDLTFWSNSNIIGAHYSADSAKQRLAEAREQFEAESEKLSMAIAEAEGKRVSARKIDVKDIIDDLIAVNDYLGVTKKNLKGTTVSVDHNAQSFPGAYKGTPESTWFTAEFTTAWFVTAIYRGTCTNRKFNLKLSETAKEEYLRNAESLK